MEPCGCDIIFYGLMSDMGGEIKFCPLHGAAEEILQAAKKVSQKATHRAGKAGQNFTDAIHELRKIIAKAERS